MTIAKPVKIAAAILTFFCVAIASFNAPSLAEAGLDPSWRLAIAKASLAHLTFGRDIVFTYGPLGYLFDGAATPETYTIDLAARVILACVVAGMTLVLCAANVRNYVRALFAAGIVVSIATRGGLWTTLAVVLISLSVLLLTIGDRFQPVRAALIGALAGIAILTKFSFGIEFVAAVTALLVIQSAIAARNTEPSAATNDLISLIGFVCAAVSVSAGYFAPRDFGSAGTAALVLISMGSFAMLIALPRYLSPTPISWLPARRKFAFLACLATMAILSLSPSYRAFLGASLQVAQGYSAAMATAGPQWQVQLAIALIALITFIAYGVRKLLGIGGIVALLIVVAFQFKEGFVRQDGHVFEFFAGTCVVLAALTWFVESARAAVLTVLAFSASLFALAAVQTSFENAPLGVALSPAAFANNVHDMFTVFEASPQNTLRDALIDDRLDDATRYSLKGSSIDVQPFETNVVFANDLKWSPEPIFQSYSAYTPSLDGLNATSLAQHPADDLLFNYSSIDGRYPMADSPLARRVLLCRFVMDPRFNHFATTRRGEPFIVLRKSGNHCSTTGSFEARAVDWGTPLTLPSSGGQELIFASIQVRSTMTGRIGTLLFRAPAVYVNLTYRTGRVLRYRILPATSESGILVAPVPSSLSDYALLSQGRLSETPVTLSLSTDGPAFYKSTVLVRLEHVHLKS